MFYGFFVGVASACTSGWTRSPPHPHPPSPRPQVCSAPFSAPAGPFPKPLLSLRLFAQATHKSRDERLRTITPLACLDLQHPRPSAPAPPSPSRAAWPIRRLPARPWPNNIKHLQHECNIRLKTDEAFGNMLLQHVCETHETFKIKHLQLATWNHLLQYKTEMTEHLEHTVDTYPTSR